jgi:hypothetical protein
MLKLGIDIGQTSIAKHAAAKRPPMQPHNPSMASFNSQPSGFSPGGPYIFAPVSPGQGPFLCAEHWPLQLLQPQLCRR